MFFVRRFWTSLPQYFIFYIVAQFSFKKNFFTQSTNIPVVFSLKDNSPIFIVVTMTFYSNGQIIVMWFYCSIKSKYTVYYTQLRKGWIPSWNCIHYLITKTANQLYILILLNAYNIYLYYIMFCINIKCIELSIINNNNIIYSSKIVQPIGKKIIWL